MEFKLIDLALALLPALLVGGIAFYFFNLHTKNEEGRRRFLLYKENQKDALPLRLQAYERLTLFLERIAPGQLLPRIVPVSDSKEEYVALLSRTIEQEFEHNITQQIYVTNECWQVVKAAKNTTVALLRKTMALESITTAQEFQQAVLEKLLEANPPSESALSYIREEVGELFR